MKSFLQKMYICLFEPRKMGLFFGEKLYKSFLHILLLSLIVVLPVTLTLSVSKEISNPSYKLIQEYLVEKSMDTDLQISDGVLSGTKGIAFLIEEGIICINPLNEEVDFDSEYDIFHIIEFNDVGMKVSFLGNIYYQKTYTELGCNELDFVKIEEADYLELDKFVSLVNVGFNNIKVEWVVINTVICLIDVLITVLFSALILAVIVKFINPMIGFRFRFKGALDAQMISLLCMFLMMLFKVEFFRFVGVILSSVYLFKAMLVIVRIEVKKNLFNDKSEGE